MSTRQLTDTSSASSTFDSWNQYEPIVLQVEEDEKGESAHMTDDKNVWADEVRGSRNCDSLHQL